MDNCLFERIFSCIRVPLYNDSAPHSWDAAHLINVQLRHAPPRALYDLQHSQQPIVIVRHLQEPAHRSDLGI